MFLKQLCNVVKILKKPIVLKSIQKKNSPLEISQLKKIQWMFCMK